MKLFFHKITNWEYWPFQVLYFPIYFLWGYYAIRAKSIFFFNASNPTIKNGGFMMESKKAIYDLLPKKYYPKTILIREQTDLSQIVNKVVEQEIYFPLIVKPDIGLRGSGVKKIKTISELKIYVEKANFDFLVQDLIPYQNELGIFYVRHPHEKEGRITGIVAKEFLIVKGDGVSSIEDLIRKTPRFMLQWDNLHEEYGDGLKRVLTKEEEINLVPFGNHARGAKFLDASNLISEKLTQTINEISAQIPEFYFGRFDIMYNSIEELERGENFQIVELNGAASEPTHIYDPKHSVWFAWKELARHITYMYEISVANHKRGFPYLTHKVGMHQYRLHLAQNNKILNF
ncbi:D-alanine--D-alanine ligase [Flavobacterium sp. Fl-77]|uniref:D-alanine--D-alanine ligase n=1 Tax=Flavobacterium flavipigmentatum TaxID=2893884 RepID=A0AAJ2S7I3_9FLAO|nr:MULTISPECIES: D-alanine--D-alanine ligase [unclassified Flavobacterium]MDX6182084.1 D-alanine--D-alanine ligase [Flavobacterium sp. Fl-33]MDX6186003.1 D-alanine--D-alanine ligase [Flavobacterium sp. Fl-77]UFH39178.1 D-alanine--D-alanine ligase [Flavobacterium sp. F-70]